MGKFFLDPSFKELHQEWSKKLKESGFEDIENSYNSKENLKTPHSRYFFSRYTPEEVEETLTYYNMCMDFYWHYPFKSKREKEIWRLHSEGMTKRKIAIVLQTQGFKVCHNLVQYYIGRLKKIMHTQTWPSEARDHGRDNTEEESDFLPTTTS